MIHYRLNTPLVAIKMPVDGAHGVLITVESGSIVVVVGEARKTGLIDVSYTGETVAIFVRDLEDRADNIGVDLPLPVLDIGDDDSVP